MALSVPTCPIVNCNNNTTREKRSPSVRLQRNEGTNSQQNRATERKQTRNRGTESGPRRPRVAFSFNNKINVEDGILAPIFFYFFSLFL